MCENQQVYYLCYHKRVIKAKQRYKIRNVRNWGILYKSKIISTAILNENVDKKNEQKISTISAVL